MNRRLEIVRRATEIFVEKGYARTSFEDIASAVGLRREALYYHFKNKSDILYDIIKPQSDALLRDIERVSKMTGTFADRLRIAIEMHLERFSPNYLEMAVAYRELSNRETTPKLQALRKTWKAYESFWIDLVAAGQKEGEVSANLDAKMAAFAILGLCNSLSSWYNPQGKIPLNEVMNAFYQIVSQGICTGTAKAPE